MNKLFLFLLASLIVLGISGCGGKTTPLTITSAAFVQGQPIPAKYTCDDQEISPPLHWSDPPAGTQSLVLIMDDPDAPGGTWDHWVLFNLPADLRELPEKATPPQGSIEGKNSGGGPGYGGPCPPNGSHRYFFKLYALDTTLDLTNEANKEQVLKAMEGHILAQAELMGTYSR